jgi:hypothetical protein
MKIKSKFNQSGIAHLLVIVLGVGVLGVLGVSGAYVSKRHAQQAKEQKTTTQTKITPIVGTTEPLKKPETTPTQSPTCTPDSTMYVTTNDGLYLREDKSFSSGKVVLMPYASQLIAGCLDGEWYRANYAGKSGYANKAYIGTSKPVIAAAPVAAIPAAAIPLSITIRGHVINCPDLPSVILGTYSTPTYSYSSPNGSIKSTYSSVTPLTKVSCASTEGWAVKGAEYFKAQDLQVAG